MDIFSSFIWRLVRTAAAIALAGAAAAVTKDPQLIWLAPVISAIAKVLRDKFGFKNIPL
jgi:hypothetical protein